MCWGKERVMAAPVRGSERDLHTLLGIVSDNRGDLSAQGLPPSLLTDLWGLIPSDFVSLFGLDSDRREQWFGQDIPAGDGDAAGEAGPEVFWSDYYWASEPCSYPDRTGDLRSVTKISDFYSRLSRVPWNFGGGPLIIRLPSDPHSGLRR